MKKLFLFVGLYLVIQSQAQQKHPAFMHQGNIYEVNIRQYTQEGTFNAFAKHLPRLKAMGVQTLWFMPIQPISKEEYKSISEQEVILNGDLIDYITGNNNFMMPIPLGASLSLLGDSNINKSNYDFEGAKISGIKPKSELIKTAFMYLNAPYLWGGKTPFGIDCSGFTQMVYKLNGYHLLRDASQQASQGVPLSFIEESEPGDLAFFDNEEGNIIHVGIIMENNYIIHASGKVRIDRIDHLGIYNAETNRHTHKLRVIKKII